MRENTTIHCVFDQLICRSCSACPLCKISCSPCIFLSLERVVSLYLHLHSLRGLVDLSICTTRECDDIKIRYLTTLSFGNLKFWQSATANDEFVKREFLRRTKRKVYEKIQLQSFEHMPARVLSRCVSSCRLVNTAPSAISVTIIKKAYKNNIYFRNNHVCRQANDVRYAQPHFFLHRPLLVLPWS